MNTQNEAPFTRLPVYEDGTPMWIEQRRHGLGSSDASTVVGMNKHKALYDLWVEKTNPNFQPRHSERTLELFEAGHRMEPVTRQWTADRLGIIIKKIPGALQSTKYPFLQSNVDGFTLEQTPRIFEAKNTSEWNRSEWENQIPDHAEIQVNHSGIVTGLEHAIVAGIIGGNTLKVYEVELSKNVQEIILERSQKFWEYHVLRDIPPEISDSELAYTQLLKAWKDIQTPKEIGGSEAQKYIEEYAHLNAQITEMNARKKALRNKIMQEAEGHKSLRVGGKQVASFARGKVNVSQLLEDHPELAEKYTKTVTEFDTKKLKAEQKEIYEKYQGRSLRVVDWETVSGIIKDFTDRSN